ncbi:MAG: hypothetical protein V7K27_12980 [Nostoc sp.]
MGSGELGETRLIASVQELGVWRDAINRVCTGVRSGEFGETRLIASVQELGVRRDAINRVCTGVRSLEL